MPRTEDGELDIDCAWKIYKQIQLLQQLLVQKYHVEFIEEEKKEYFERELEQRLPF